MKACDIRVGESTLIELRPALREDFGRPIEKLAEVLLYSNGDVGEAVLSDGKPIEHNGEPTEHIWPVRGVGKHDDSRLVEIFQRPLPRIAYVAAVHPRQHITTRVVVQVHSFVDALFEPTDVSIGVSDRVTDYLAEKDYLDPKANNRTAAAIDWLTENTIIDATSSQPMRMLLSGNVKQHSAARPSFRIYGRNIAVDVRRANEGVWEIEWVAPGASVSPTDMTVIMMLRGCFKYVDASVATQVRGLAPSILESLVSQSSSYLGLWQEYNELEKSSIYRRAHELGWLRYNGYEVLRDGTWRFCVLGGDELHRALERLQDEQETDLEISQELPEPLRDNEINDSMDYALDERTVQGPVFAGQCTNVSFADRTVNIRPIDPDTIDKPPDKGYIHAALRGDEVRLKRRREAQQRIKTLSGPMPQLALLIEGHNAPIGERKRIEVKPSVVADLIGGYPTPQQIEAINVALNTPDIALIQGPPGTGKTRIIAALQTILGNNDPNHGAGQILLTSYQHDAVDNAAARTRVLGLPAVRVGKRSNVSGNLVSDIDRWRHDSINQIRSHLDAADKPPIRQALQRVQALTKGYILNPGNSRVAIRVLEQVYEHSIAHISGEMSDALLSLIRQLRMSDVPQLDSDFEERMALLTTIRGLRTDLTSFGDDGASNARRLLGKLKRNEDAFKSATPEDLQLISLAAEPAVQPSSEMLAQLKALQSKLIDERIRPPQLERITALNSHVAGLLTEVSNELYRRSLLTPAGVDDVLYEYVHDLEYDPAGVQESIKEYSVVLAATCQQSVNTEMLRQKDNKNDFVFTTVIVDEAARANPLDLLIPMARAQRRIILVGDHRQLPHILEPDVERGLAQSNSDTQERLSKSLFERLFVELSKLERIKGAVKRTVTLDTQYRMHPVLGDFVSDVFYRPYGEEFRSIRPACDFLHNIPHPQYAGKVAVWVDLPFTSYGGEQGRHSKGKSRRKEAKWVVQEAKQILQIAPRLSVGIITFYSDQVKEMQCELVAQGMAQDGDNGFELLPDWALGEDEQRRSTERLRVGTVDSFQGKEFDVVILSLTRSNTFHASNAVEARRKYGFLTIENRLCVAMSRQKRLLIIAGDAAMVANPAESSSVAGLRKFYELCGGEYGARLSA